MSVAMSVLAWVRKLKGNETGFALLETLVALGILGFAAATFVGGVATATKVGMVTSEHAMAESLIRSEMEYVKNYAYQYSASSYPVNPALEIPEGWTVPSPVVGLVHASDDGIQRVTVTAERNGDPVLSIVMYKVDR